MDQKLAQEIKLRLKAPIVAMKRVAQGISVPKVFGEAGLSELKRIKKIVDKFDKNRGETKD